MKTVALIAATKGTVNKDIMNQLFNAMFGEFKAERSEEVAELSGRLDNFIDNYVVSMKPAKGAKPIDDINLKL